VTAVKAANEKNVPILAHNFITPFSEGKVASYIGYDQWGGAEKLAKTTCDLIAKRNRGWRTHGCTRTTRGFTTNSPRHQGIWVIS